MNCVDPSGYYNANDAVKYAKKWALAFNPDYIFVRSGDCANFVSQCLFAGGINTTSSWAPSYYTWSISFRGVSKIYITRTYNYYYSWSFAKGLFFEFIQDRYCDGVGWFNVYNKDEVPIKNIVKNIASFVEEGDILFYSSSFDADDIYHAVVVTCVSEFDVKICAHTTARRNKSLIELLITAKIKSVFAVSIREDAV